MSGSRLHSCRSDVGEEGDLMAVCRHTPFRFGAQRGQGLVDAAQTGRQWSPRCRRRLLERVGSDRLAGEQQKDRDAQSMPIPPLVRNLLIWFVSHHTQLN